MLMLACILFVSNCSKIPLNNDPILGTWVNTQNASTQARSNVTIKEEWIFNDVYMGRYHKYEGGVQIIISDFGWSKDEDTYTITYPGLDRSDAQVILFDGIEGSDVLQTENGQLFAERERLE